MPQLCSWPAVSSPCPGALTRCCQERGRRSPAHCVLPASDPRHCTRPAGQAQSSVQGDGLVGRAGLQLCVHLTQSYHPFLCACPSGVPWLAGCPSGSFRPGPSSPDWSTSSPVTALTATWSRTRPRSHRPRTQGPRSRTLASLSPAPPGHQVGT